MSTARHYIPRSNNVNRYADTYAAVVAFVAAYQPCSFETLFALFAEKGLHARPKKAFRSRLVWLEQKNQLVSTGSQEMRLWSLAPGVVVANPQPPQQVAALLPVEPVYRVPPRQHNVLLGTYEPPRAASLRPGALDFARVPSRGVAC